MSILTKPEKKTKPLMVRIPKNLIRIIDTAFVGHEYSSRPDFIVDAARSYIDNVSYVEVEAIMKLEGKEVTQTVKQEFYLEYLEARLKVDRNAYKSAEEKSKGETVDVLLSVMPDFILRINEVVERTHYFKNHHEFIKMAIIFRTRIIADRNTNSLILNNYFQNSEDMESLRDELRRVWEEAEHVERRNANIHQDKKY